MNRDALDQYDDPLFCDPQEPQCGWLSPEGWFAPCIPWRHAEVACSLIRAMGVRLIDLGILDSHEYLFDIGWVKVDRSNKADHRRVGGQFRFVARRPLTEAQVEFERVWLELGAVELLSG